MIVVVADTSPLVALVNIECTHILPALFGSVIIPPRVGAELNDPRRSEAVRGFIAAAPPWLQIREPGRVEAIPSLHDGEREAISLALELGAHLLLIDDREGRAAAIHRGIQTTRTAALLVRAARAGLIDLEQAFGRLAQTDFRISRRVLATLLPRGSSTDPSGSS